MENLMKNIPTNFIVSTYGEVTPENENFSRTRMRVFYTGINRNGSLITDSFAQNLIASAYGNPIVGKYDATAGDFTDHATKEETKPYGFVPQDMNFAWEDSLDEDGVTRSYACFDVLLWTGRYEEALSIMGKPQSMELNPKSINGTWKVIDGDTVFEFEKGVLWGFCVLGQNVEPCFEGSNFFSLETDYKLFFEDMRNFALSQFTIEEGKENQGGKDNVEEKNTELETKLDATLDSTLETNLETNLEDNANHTADVDSTDAPDAPEVDNALTDNEDSKINLDDSITSDFSATYRAKREALYALMPREDMKDEQGEDVGETEYYLADFDDQYAYVERYTWSRDGSTSGVGRFSYTVAEDGTMSLGAYEPMVAVWLTMEEAKKIDEEKAVNMVKFTEMESKVASLETELLGLKEYKFAQENQVKFDLIDTFKEILTDEEITSIKDKVAEYTIEQLDEKLCALAYKKSATSSNYTLIHNDINTSNSDGVIALLQKHKQ